jgi:mannosyltransferase PIG-V
MRDRAGLGGWATPVWLLLIFVASRLLLVAVAAFVEATVPIPAGGSASTAPILRSLAASDGVWYVGIAADGYHADALRGPFHDYVFFPLYPLLLRAASVLTGGDLVLAGVLVSNAAFVGALVLFARASRALLDEAGVVVAAAFLAFAPGAVAFAMAYTDSLFLLLALGAVLAARAAAWPLMSLLFGLAALTRLPGVVLLVPLAMLIAERIGWRAHRLWLWLLSGPLALLAFLGYVWGLTGDPLAWPKAQAAWNNPPDTVAPPDMPSIPTWVIVVALIVVVAMYLFQLVYLRRSGIPRPEAAYAIVGLIALSLTARIVSLPRYLAVLWPFPWLFTARRSAAFHAAGLAAFVAGFVVLAYLNFTTLVAARQPNPRPTTTACRGDVSSPGRSSC